MTETYYGYELLEDLAKATSYRDPLGYVSDPVRFFSMAPELVYIDIGVYQSFRLPANKITSGSIWCAGGSYDFRELAAGVSISSTKVAYFRFGTRMTYVKADIIEAEFAGKADCYVLIGKGNPVHDYCKVYANREEYLAAGYPPLPEFD